MVEIVEPIIVPHIVEPVEPVIVPHEPTVMPHVTEEPHTVTNGGANAAILSQTTRQEAQHTDAWIKHCRELEETFVSKGSTAKQKEDYIACVRYSHRDHRPLSDGQVFGLFAVGLIAVGIVLLFRKLNVL